MLVWLSGQSCRLYWPLVWLTARSCFVKKLPGAGWQGQVTRWQTAKSWKTLWLSWTTGRHNGVMEPGSRHRIQSWFWITSWLQGYSWHSRVQGPGYPEAWVGLLCMARTQLTPGQGLKSAVAHWVQTLWILVSVHLLSVAWWMELYPALKLVGPCPVVGCGLQWP